jgi:hypothetical protein
MTTKQKPGRTDALQFGFRQGIGAAIKAAAPFHLTALQCC